VNDETRKLAITIALMRRSPFAAPKYRNYQAQTEGLNGDADACPAIRTCHLHAPSTSAEGTQSLAYMCFARGPNSCHDPSLHPVGTGGRKGCAGQIGKGPTRT
jgi:hypothetical protein